MKDYRVLKELVIFNTIRDKENKEIVNFIELYLKKLGFESV